MELLLFDRFEFGDVTGLTWIVAIKNFSANVLKGKVENPENESAEIQKMGKVSYSLEEMQQLEEVLKLIVMEQKPYLDEDLSLRSLADLIGTSRQKTFHFTQSISKNLIL